MCTNLSNSKLNELLKCKYPDFAPTLILEYQCYQN